MLKQRIITAAILLPIALIGFFLLEGLAFALFIGLVVSLGAWEWARLAGFAGQPVRVGYALVVVLLLALLYRISVPISPASASDAASSRRRLVRARAGKGSSVVC